MDVSWLILYMHNRWTGLRELFDSIYRIYHLKCYMHCITESASQCNWYIHWKTSLFL